MFRFQSIVITVALIVGTAYSCFGQKPQFKGISKQTILAKNANQGVPLQFLVSCTGLPIKELKIDLKFEILSANKTVELISNTLPKSYIFGKDFSNEYPITLNFVKDADSTTIHIVRVKLIDQTDTTKVYDSVIVIYKFEGISES